MDVAAPDEPTGADLGRATSPQVGAATVPDGHHPGPLLIPLGALEQHGPHLPLSSDSTIAAAVCARVAERLRSTGRPALVAPVLGYGASGEHEGFPGTVSIGTEALQQVVLELVRSARRWCRQVVLVTGHGGNAEALTTAVTRLRHEGHDVVWTSCAEPGWDAHAGHAETSMMQALRPDQVGAPPFVPGAREPVADLLPRLRSGGVAAVSPSGVLGDPRQATPADGRAHLEQLAGRIAAQLEHDLSDSRGCLVRPHRVPS